MERLFISCGTMSSGGAERVISVLATPFVNHYREVTICLWVSAPIFYHIDSRVRIIDIERESRSKYLIKKMKWFRCFVQKESPDLLLSFLYPWSMTVLFALLFTNTPVVVAERQDPRVVRGGIFVKLIRHFLYLRTKGIIVQTNENKQYYRCSLNKKTHAIYNPVAMTQDWVGRAIESPKTDTIVAVGRLNPAKNHELLINAFDHFLKKHPQYKLQIYGDGDLEEYLKRLIKQLDLDNNVFLMGSDKEVFQRIITARAFVLSSRYEGMPNALIEAMCLGLPCISTKVSGSTELIDSGVNGILVNNDVDELSRALESITDISFSESMARNAILLYKKVNKNNICKQWINYLDSIGNGVQ